MFAEFYNRKSPARIFFRLHCLNIIGVKFFSGPGSQADAIPSWNSEISNDFDSVTPPKFNMEPENASLEKEKHLQTTSFGVPC